MENSFLQFEGASPTLQQPYKATNLIHMIRWRLEEYHNILHTDQTVLPLDCGKSIFQSALKRCGAVQSKSYSPVPK